MSKRGGVFSIFRRADDVTRTMSKGGGGAPGVPPIQVQTPPPTWLAGYGPAIVLFVGHDANLKGFCASVNPTFEGRIPDFMDRISCLCNCIISIY